MIRKVGLSIALPGALFFIIWFITTFDLLTWDFRNNLWAPAYLLVHGESPYHIQNLIPGGSSAVWFPQIIGMFFPLGLFPLQQASNLWVMIITSAAVGMVIVLIGRVHPQSKGPIVSGLILLSVLLFPGTVTNILLGQLDFLVIIVLILAASKIQEEGYTVIALCFAIALGKPQLGCIVLPSVFISLLLQGKWRYGLLLLLSLGAAMILLTIPLWVAYPPWVHDFLSNIRNNPTGWLQPSLFAILKMYLGQAGVVAWLVLAILCLTISTFLWIKLPHQQAVLWSMALTTIAAPYIWSWDFTLLLPLFVDTAARSTKIYARIVLASAWMISSFFHIWTLRFTTSDHRLWWMPLVLLLGILTSIWVEHRTKPVSGYLAPHTDPSTD